MKYLGEASAAQGITRADQLFQMADPAFKGTITTEELKEAIKNTLKGSVGLNFKKLEKVLDVRGNGYITRTQFVDLVENALASDADTSEYHRIAESLTGSQSKQQDLGKSRSPSKATQQERARARTVRFQEQPSAQEAPAGAEPARARAQSMQKPKAS